MGAFVAKYRSRCLGCGEDIEPGERAVYVDDMAVHERCESDARLAVVIASPRPVCGSCFLEKPCSCDDGQGPRS